MSELKNCSNGGEKAASNAASNAKKMTLVFFLCGLISALPYVFPKLWIISWFGLSPMIYLQIRYGAYVPRKRAYLNGLVFGAGYFGVMYHWFANLYPVFEDLGAFGAIGLILICWIGLALLQSIEFGFLPFFYRLICPKGKRSYVCALLFTAMWVIFEWQETLFWRGVPWARMAVSQSAVPFMQQSASLFGSMFTSAVIVAVNALIAAAFVELSENGGKIKQFVKNKKSVILSLVALGVFTANALFGVVRMAVMDDKSGEPVKAAVIQGNVSSLDKWADDSANTSTALYIELTEKCVDEYGAQIVIWPETVIPTSIRYNNRIMNELSELAKRRGITLFVGAFDDVYSEETDDYSSYNAIFVFHSDGTLDDTCYYKRHLVPFGEYTPMEGFVNAVLPVLAEMNLLSDPLTPGNDSNVFETEYGTVGSLICFDSIYETLAVDAVRDGAEIITLSTNDSWFSDSAAVYQHNSHAALRAIETGRYVVRAANTGVSSIITPKGVKLTEIEPLVKGYACETVYARSQRTLYSYVGNLFVYICIFWVVNRWVYWIAISKKTVK